MLCKNQYTGALFCVALAIPLIAACTSTAWAQKGGHVQGIVYNTAGDLALDAEVRVVGMGLLTAVDEEASFSFSYLPDGAHILEAVSPRWGRGILEVSVKDGQTSEVTLEVVVHVDLEEVVVSAGPVAVTRSRAVQPADALSHQDLVEASEGSLGETLTNKVGITSTYFGPGSSRPIIRGVGGNRVSVLQQGLTVADVSDISPDHAPAVEALLTDRIEVIRGPATLLYGSSAIGGVVNLHDGRVPSEKPTSAISGTLTGRLSSVSRGRTGALKLRGARGNVAWALSGLARATEEFRVPKGSIVEEEDHGDENGGSHDNDSDQDEVVNSIANSNVSLNRGSAGLSYVESWGYIGAAITLHGTKYGLPGHREHHEEEGEHEEEEEDEDVRVDMGQVAFDLEGHWRAYGDFLRGVRFRLGSSAYTHDELEGGEVGTTFDNNLIEGRLEMDHVLADGFNGVVGLQLDRRELTLTGHEAFMPGSSTSRLSLFLLERLNTGAFGLEGGLRYERADISPDQGRKRTFSAFSVGGGANFQYSEDMSLSIGVARSIKIPHPGELYAHGLHVATQAFEIGDEHLGVETALSLDLSAHVHHDRFEATASVFSNQYSDFIYLRLAQDTDVGAAVYRVSQGEASFRGFEVEAEFELYHEGYHHVALRLMSDYTRAQQTDDAEPLPRIPPFRVGGELTYDTGSLEFSASIKSVSAQKRVAQYENPTNGYIDLGAGIQYRIFRAVTGHVISLQGRNLTNAVARPHTSFLKDLVPLPGRDVRLTYRILF